MAHWISFRCELMEDSIQGAKGMREWPTGSHSGNELMEDSI